MPPAGELDALVPSATGVYLRNTGLSCAAQLTPTSVLVTDRPDSGPTHELFRAQRTIRFRFAQ